MFEFVTIFLISLLFLRFFPNIADRFGLIDTPKSRSIHNKPIPRGAGVVFTPAVILGYILYSDIDTYQYNHIIFAIVLIWLVGLIDDIKEISPKVKFISIAVAVIIISYDGYTISTIHNFAYTTLYLGILTIPFTYFAVAGFTNAFNLIDGMDALATSIALLISIFFIYLGYSFGDTILEYTALSLSASLLAFLIYNKPKAKLFMGDSGSLTLGFMLSILFIESIKYVDAVSVLYIGALPVTDTLISMLRRSRDGYSLVSADKCHLHHLFLYITGSVYKTLAILIAYQVVMMAIGYLTSSRIDSAYMFILYILHIAILYQFIIYLKDRYNIICYPNSKEGVECEKENISK